MAVPRDTPSRALSRAARSATGRILSIDRYRGALVMLMVAGNFAGGVASVPAWLKHTPTSD